MGNKIIRTSSIKQGLYEISSTARGEIGGIREFEDGRKFIYALAGEELTLGTVCQGPVEDASGYWEQMAVATTVAAGDKTITITTQSVITENQFKDGWLIVEDETADIQGTLRKIKYHPAAGSAASLVITVYDPFVTAVTAGTDEVSLMKNPYSGILENNATTDGPLVGLPTMTVTDAYYFWLQVRGPAAVTVAEGTVLPGQMMVVDGQAGLVLMEDGATDSEEIGRSMNSCDTNGNSVIVYLTLG